ncbi:hypothetical protein L195_g042658 [Trifolium pratense]|uniref:Uncharacterized protein n=1 Tax=Trifolium pratense TaxID=57577 RepID=A0A2K3M742_TRIPR|nr:hypothetical protein L195_g042658 [Trifolium pratense]
MEPASDWRLRPIAMVAISKLFLFSSSIDDDVEEYCYSCVSLLNGILGYGCRETDSLLPALYWDNAVTASAVRCSFLDVVSNSPNSLTSSSRHHTQAL